MINHYTPLIAHVIHRLNIGGLENGLVNLINNLPSEKYRHVIICLTESSEFSQRIERSDVDIYELHKKDGKDPVFYFRLWRLFRQIKPTIVHTRNISTLEANVVAALAGVRLRIHGEHGRDMYDLHGKNKRYQQLRRFCAPFVDRFVVLSKDLENWLKFDVGITRNKIVQLYNGVDTERFHKSGKEKIKRHSMPKGFADENSVVLGTVGRLEPVKDQLTLLRAFIKLNQLEPDLSARLRLVLLGDGSLRPKLEELIEQNNLCSKVWVAGSQENVQVILCELDIFVLPSLGEGISNTILEAMACALPVIATNVGGNPELVVEDITGQLVPANDPSIMAEALRSYINDKARISRHGQSGRKRIEELFSMSEMLKSYQLVYDSLLETSLIK